MSRPRHVLWVALLLLVVMIVLADRVAAGRAATPATVITLQTDELASAAPFMGLGVELDPYDSFNPTPAQWGVVFQRLDVMRPGFIRVVEPASDYFAGYDAAGNPLYEWSRPHVQQLLTILGYAKSRGIPVVIGDWSNPLINGDARIPAGFLQQLHDAYGYTNIKYYNMINEPNDVSGCQFDCWTASLKAPASELTAVGVSNWLAVVGPDNANSWDDTAAAQAIDRSSGLDADNPTGGDSWLTAALATVPALIGAYDSHRYATIWGVENGVFGDQMRARREQINNLDSPAKPYFAGEVGMTARQTSPFGASFDRNGLGSLAPALDPSARASASSFVDSQPHIGEFGYGVWMGDMMVQAISSGLAGASAWDLDDAMHTGGQYGSLNLKQWGFWNSLGGQFGYPLTDQGLRPWYYPWSVLSRSFPADAQPLLTAASRQPGVRLAAAKIPGPRGDSLSIAAVNDSDTPHEISVTVPSAATPVTLARYDYFAADTPVDANGFPVPAQVLPGVQLSAGVTIPLPSRGLVVLTSLGGGAALRLSAGRQTVLDELVDWRGARGRSKGLALDHSNPAQFNADGSRADVTAKAKGAQFLIYRAPQITSFVVRAYYAKALSLSAYRSQDGRSWEPVALASTNPAPSVGGGQYLADVLPAEPIPAGTNRLKIVIGKGSEVGQVTIHARRAGPACLAAGVQPGPGSLAGISLGGSRRRVRGLFGVPSAAGTTTWHYCVVDGGEAVVVFDRAGAASLIASSAPRLRINGIGPGSSVGSLWRRLRHHDLRSVAGRGLLASTTDGPIAFLTGHGQVRAVAIASTTLLRNTRSLIRALSMTHL